MFGKLIGMEDPGLNLHGGAHLRQDIQQRYPKHYEVVGLEAWNLGELQKPGRENFLKMMLFHGISTWWTILSHQTHNLILDWSLNIKIFTKHIGNFWRYLHAM